MREIKLSLHFMLLQRNADPHANIRTLSDVLVRNNILLSIHQGSFMMLPSRNERLRKKSVHNNHIHCKHFFFFATLLMTNECTETTEHAADKLTLCVCSFKDEETFQRTVRAKQTYAFYRTLI